MTDPETTSILEQAQRRANELAVTADATETQGEAAVSLSASGKTWTLKWWAKVRSKWATPKPEASTGVEYTRRWFGGW